jgi:hypothetical protein
VGANGGRVEDEGTNGAHVKGEGAWYEAEVEAHVLEDEGWRGRRYPLSPRKFTTCKPPAQAHHLLHLCPYPVQHHVFHRRAHMLGQQVHLPSCVVLSRSDKLLVQRNFSECDLNLI